MNPDSFLYLSGFISIKPSFSCVISLWGNRTTNVENTLRASDTIHHLPSLNMKFGAVALKIMQANSISSEKICTFALTN